MLRYRDKAPVCEPGIPHHSAGLSSATLLASLPCLVGEWTTGSKSPSVILLFRYISKTNKKPQGQRVGRSLTFGKYWTLQSKSPSLFFVHIHTVAPPATRLARSDFQHTRSMWTAGFISKLFTYQNHVADKLEGMCSIHKATFCKVLQFLTWSNEAGLEWNFTTDPARWTVNPDQNRGKPIPLLFTCWSWSGGRRVASPSIQATPPQL